MTMSRYTLKEDLGIVQRMLKQLEPLADAFRAECSHDDGRERVFMIGETEITDGSLKAAHLVWQDLRVRERDLKELLCEPLACKLVTPLTGTIFERTFTGTYRGRQMDLLRGVNK